MEPLSNAIALTKAPHGDNGLKPQGERVPTNCAADSRSVVLATRMGCCSDRLNPGQLFDGGITVRLKVNALEIAQCDSING